MTDFTDADRQEMRAALGEDGSNFLNVELDLMLIGYRVAQPAVTDLSAAILALSTKSDDSTQFVCGYIQARNEAAALAATMPSRPTVPEGWKPIESADKSGKQVLLFSPSDRFPVSIGYFSKYLGRPAQWLNAGCHSVNPTHWQPLPAAPSPLLGDAT